MKIPGITYVLDYYGYEDRLATQVDLSKYFCKLRYYIFKINHVDNVYDCVLQEWNAPKPMHKSLLNASLRWTIVSIQNSDEKWK